MWSIPMVRTSSKDGAFINMGLLLMGFIFVLGSIRISAAEAVSQAKYNAMYFGWMGIRMIFALTTMAIYLVISDVKNKWGVIFLLISYFIYMGFEIRIFLHKLRTDSEKSQNADNARK
jgi:heme/copper-type cytochrome/quinol oxidase subunit 4